MIAQKGQRCLFFQTNLTYMSELCFQTLILTFSIMFMLNYEEICFSISRPSIDKGRRCHCLHKGSAVTVGVQPLSCCQRLEAVTTQCANHLWDKFCAKEVFVFWWEAIQFLLIKQNTKTMKKNSLPFAFVYLFHSFGQLQLVYAVPATTIKF